MSDDLFDALSPVLAASGLELVDLQLGHGHVQVTVDRSGGVDLDALAEANKAVSQALDELEPVPGPYTLEVTSPGLERRLRLPAHFQRALGETVSVRILPGDRLGTGNVRRVEGELVAADDEGFVVAGPDVPGERLRIAYADVDRARTVFSWGAAPKPGGAGGASRQRGKRPTSKRKAAAAAAEGARSERVTS